MESSATRGRRTGHRHPMHPQEAELVPVAALEHDAPIPHMEEAAAAQPQGIPPFEDGPITVLEQVLGNAGHLGGGEAVDEHLPYRFAPGHRLLRDLVVDRVIGIEPCQRVDVAPVEGVDPGFDEFAGSL